MKYLAILFTTLLVSACSESPEESRNAATNPAADAPHAHDGEAHSHEGDADQAHESTETKVFYGDQAESASEVGAIGDASDTGLNHEHDESSDHHHEELNTDEHNHDDEDSHQHENADHYDEGGEDHQH